MISDDNGFFYRGLFQYNKNTKDYFHNPVLAVCLTCEAHCRYLSPLKWQ